ncbi:unnamed protein product [Rotaria socialis]|uniref:Uncharacterized protein n=1 Tax=Rotaria socialis TaxID=392032 RepID=A0A818TS78_9BILA|nr:unnamed protein product [Rotaria socialis]CAF3783809.1 unnamed protein product [Rotaria socialis]CAF4455930.1 unnamed protein product [Rotaria socialis]CAF4737647.1 unnamed protein product [Rotaria socialis]
MSSSVRSFFRSKRSRSKEINIIQQNSKEIVSQQPTTRLTSIEDNRPRHFLLSDVNEWITSMHSQRQSVNISCCGGDDKKNAIKNQVNAPRLSKETPEPIKQNPDPIESDDHKVEHIVQQHAIKVDTHDNLHAKQELTKAIMNQLVQRALTRPMNVHNDDPPRLCTKKHCSFANEPLTIKPVTCVPGIGPKHGDLCEKHGIIMAHQLLSRYMISANDDEFKKSLVNQLGFTPKSATMTRDGLREMRRHLI